MSFVPRAAAGRVDQHQVEFGHPLDRGLHLVGSGDDFHRQIHDLSISPQLLDGRDSIGVDRDQSHAALLLQAEVRRQLGDRRRFADTRRSHERHDAAAAASQANRTTNAQLPFDQWAACDCSMQLVVSFVRINMAFDSVQQLASVHIGNAGVDQVGEQLEHSRGALRLGAALPVAELIDQRGAIFVQILPQPRAEFVFHS